MLEISGNRYYKIHPDSSTTFQTRLVSKGGVYSYNSNNLEHANCIPYLAKAQASSNHKIDAELRKVKVLHVSLSSRKATKKVDLKDKLFEQAKEIEEIRKPLLMELKRQEDEMNHIKESKENFRDW